MKPKTRRSLKKSQDKVMKVWGIWDKKLECFVDFKQSNEVPTWTNRWEAVPGLWMPRKKERVG